MKISCKYNYFHSRKCIWKYCLQIGGHFFQASICHMIYISTVTLVFTKFSLTIVSFSRAVMGPVASCTSEQCWCVGHSPIWSNYWSPCQRLQYPVSIQAISVVGPVLGCWVQLERVETVPDSKVHGANMGPIWGWQDPDGPHVGPMNLAIWGVYGNTEYLISSKGQWVNEKISLTHCLVQSDIMAL